MTYLEIINKVLLRLREDAVADWDETNYSQLIGEYVNEVKREVEDSWDWGNLRQTVQATTASNVFRYEITGVKERGKVLQVWNDTEDYLLRPASSNYLTTLFNTNNTPSGKPMFYDTNGLSADNDLYIDMWPVPDGVYTINVDCYAPQDELAANSTKILAPSWPVILGAYALAVSERGENGGIGYSEAYERYRGALSDAIATDARNYSDETTWRVC
jgi:hypothetical protein